MAQQDDTISSQRDRSALTAFCKSLIREIEQSDDNHPLLGPLNAIHGQLMVDKSDIFVISRALDLIMDDLINVLSDRFTSLHADIQIFYDSMRGYVANRPQAVHFNEKKFIKAQRLASSYAFFPHSTNDLINYHSNSNVSKNLIHYPSLGNELDHNNDINTSASIRRATQMNSAEHNPVSIKMTPNGAHAPKIVHQIASWVGNFFKKFFILTPLISLLRYQMSNIKKERKVLAESLNIYKNELREYREWAVKFSTQSH